ncbi:MAG TPA: VIT1/CCC1 family protein [Anaeromyxobacteraceae bacterium]|nr:VIT1/CCC1 family protein [Anaeromyxobacteraceae bacterium]
MPERTDLWLLNLVDERDGAALYEGLAQIEKDPSRARSFRELAEGERRHAEVWLRKLERAGAPLPPDRPSSRIRVLLWLARRLGTGAVLPLVVENEGKDADKYASQGGADAVAMVKEEQEHRRVLVGLRGEDPDEARSLITDRERWHRGGGRAGSLRAAIFGMNDGLVSNLLLVLGVAGTGADTATLFSTGAIGLLAGAASMAAGEYDSVATQRDVLTKQVEMERREIAEAPEEETAELALIFKQKGLSTEQAARTAAEILKNPEHALDTLVREELGLDPNDLGSPWGAALASFGMFSIGAAIPLVPYLLASGDAAIFASAALSSAALLGVGALMSFLSGTRMLPALGRKVVVLGVGAATWLIGRLVGAAIG